MNEYIFNSALGVYCLATENQFSYSDGDEVESRIQRIISEATDVTTGSQEIFDKISDWSTLYHFSHKRLNLLRPIESLLKGDILEMGSGCGIITRYLGELGGNIVALEGSLRRASITASRCRGLNNVQVICDNIQSLKVDKKFDVITLIGVLEYSPTFIKDLDPVGCILKKALSLLKPNGILLIAIENQLGLKYFAGAPEDHIGLPYFGVNDLYEKNSVITFGKKELTCELVRCGFTNQIFYYPFPDYKLPEVIIPDYALQERSLNLTSFILSHTSYIQAHHYIRAFNEECALSPILRNGLLGDLANSFLVVTSPSALSEKLSPDDGLAFMYKSADWQKKFSKETKIIRKNGEIIVQRRRVYPNVGGSTQYIQQVLVDEPFLNGPLLSDYLHKILNKKGWSYEDVINWSKLWIDFLIANAVNPEVMQSSNYKIDQLYLPNNFIDCTPFNLIYDEEKNSLTAIDLEWVANEPQSIGYIVFRGLLGSLAKIKSFALPSPEVLSSCFEILLNVMNCLGFDVKKENILEWLEQENLLQCAVQGKTPSNDLKNDILNNYESLKHWKINFCLPAQVDSLNDQLNAASNQLALERNNFSGQLNTVSIQLATERESFAEQLNAVYIQLTVERNNFAEQLSALSTQLAAERENFTEQLNAIYRTTSWKITAPLRWVSLKFPNLLRVIRKMLTAIRRR